MTGIRETCGCGSGIKVEHPDPAPIARDWRDTHPCDRRGGERDIIAGATADIADIEPHRTDSTLRGFGRADDTQPIQMPATRRDLREAL